VERGIGCDSVLEMSNAQRLISLIWRTGLMLSADVYWRLEGFK